MTQEDVVLLIKHSFKEAAGNIRDQAGFADKLKEPGISDALTQVADCMDDVDVEFHVGMLSIYREEEAEDAE